MTTRNFTPLLVATVLLLLPPALYVGSYYLLAVQSYSDYRPFASYRYGGKAAEIFYKPLELADHRIRPRRWEPLFVQPAAGEGP